jgi:hypothetical protein
VEQYESIPLQAEVLAHGMLSKALLPDVFGWFVPAVNKQGMFRRCLRSKLLVKNE